MTKAEDEKMRIEKKKKKQKQRQLKRVKRKKGVGVFFFHCQYDIWEAKTETRLWAWNMAQRLSVKC